ncbi:DUF3857 domain-containing protein [Lewinella sp. W8]|uniref:DUF3857 domain-containing protein n=1 Tax=Lewinella sp. W8 TaxID=2528208 RepID=UPI0010685BB3|nr:DUF3857 domain-containing protein [Lewinella sp. W8]MTB50972.1 DUF3857 domain-containing protein [Lewinella sp. W8]
MLKQNPSLFGLILFLLACTLPEVVVAQDDGAYAVVNINPELLSGATSVVRHHSIEYRVNSDRVAFVRHRKVITLLNSNHDRDNVLVVPYDGDTRITQFKAVLYDAAGEKVRSAKKSEIEDVRYLTGGQFYTDARIQTTTLNHSSYPYTIEFEYEIKQTDVGVFGFPSWMPQDFNQAVEYSSFTATLPTSNELLYFGNQLPEANITEEGNDRRYFWEVENLKAVVKEVECPPISRVLPYLRTGLRTFDLGDYVGSLNDWQSFGAFIAKLMEGRSELPEQLRALVQEKTAGLSTDREKINVLYRLLQERTRYVGVQLGIGGWQPFPADYVEENRFGDCKALSNYMGAMLAEVGIASQPVLIYSGHRQFFPVDASFTTNAFNHMILYVPSEDMFLECTSSTAPPGYLGSSTSDRNVLLLSESGGELARTPALVPSENGYVRHTTVEIQPDGSAAFSTRGRFFGTEQEWLRGLLHQEEDQGERLKYLASSEFVPNITGEGLVLNCNPDDPIAELDYRTSLKAYGRKLGTRMFVPLNKFYRFEWIPDQLETRHHDIHSLSSRFLVDTVQLALPENMEVESMGDTEVAFSHPVGNYSSKLQQEGNLITWIRTFKLIPVELPADTYEDYRQFFVDVAKADKRQVVLKVKRTK